MNNDINDIEHKSGPTKGKVIAGVILLAVGATLLLRQFDFLRSVNWLFSWPMWLIVWGIWIGAKHNFRNAGSFIMIVIGLAFLVDDIFPHMDVSAFFWPVALIAFGLFLILRRKNHSTEYFDKKDWKRKWDQGKYNFGGQSATTAEPIVDYTVKSEDEPTDTTPPPNTGSTNTNTNYTGDEHLEAISVFGSVKKTIFSKNFQGGEIVNVMGGAELDFTQANIDGRVYIDVTQIFGGTKIIVPSHWMVVSDMAAIFAGVDDKRIRTNAPLDSTKILVLKGVSIFAGIDIRSY